MGLQVAGRRDDVDRADHPAHPPAGHREGLRHPAEHHGGLGELGDGLQHRGEGHAVVGEGLVDLVGDHPDAVLERPAPDLGDLLG
eukprot:Nk52_evm1s2490 gene=Nk52_evmTU1s2490